MKRWLSLFACLLTLPAWAGDWRDDIAAPQPGKFPAPRPYKATYHFGWSGIVAAQADLDFAKAAHGQFQLAMKTQTIGAARTLWRMDSQHTAWCSAATLRPIRLEQSEVYKSESEVTKAEFEPEKVHWITVETPPPAKPPRLHRFKCDNVLDLQTGWLYLRSQRLQVGDHYRFIVWPATGGYLADFEVLGRETLKVAAGTYDAIKFQVRLQEVTKNYELKPHQKFKRAYAWISDDRDRMLLRIQADVFIGSVWCEVQTVAFP